jgi:hypothetical protein
MKKTTTILSAMILLLSVGVCTGEPDAVMKYLMNEPVSMLDWGLFRLDKGLIDPILSDKGVMASSGYNYSQNKIIINISIIDYPDKKKKSAKEIKESCRETIDFVKTVLKQVPLDVYFIHEGFAKKDAPKITSEHIRWLVEIYCSGTHESGRIIGKSSLNENEIYFSEEKGG